VDLTSAIRSEGLALGFDAIGFAPAESSEDAKAWLAEYLKSGMHGDMGWMAAHAERRADPKKLWPEARSVVVVAMSYAPPENPLSSVSDPESGEISVYARTVRDYHDVLKSRLKRLARWTNEVHGAQVKIFVDTAPVLEKHLAQRAGIGWQGKHSNLVSRGLGNWFFLGEMFTDIDLTPDAVELDHCGSCRNCLEACPTDAFVAPYKLDARRCISYLTIEHKSHIDYDLMGGRIYGCDDCLAVCPWNKFAELPKEPALWPRVELQVPKLKELAGLDDAEFRQVFAGSPIKRTGRDRFVRNVAIAIGNSDLPELAETAAQLTADSSPLVRRAAIWALSRLEPERANLMYRNDPDPEVQAEWDRMKGVQKGDVL
jgi:epoxyqueuosine reductase